MNIAFYVFVLVFTLLICGLIAARIADIKGRSPIAYYCTAMLLGPLGVLIAALLPKTKDADGIKAGELKRCPAGLKSIKVEASQCRDCGTDIDVDENCIGEK